MNIIQELALSMNQINEIHNIIAKSGVKCNFDISSKALKISKHITFNEYGCVLIPFAYRTSTIESSEIISTLDNLGYDDIDYINGYVKDKHGRQVKIGKILRKENPELLSLYEKDKANPSTGVSDEYEILISRNIWHILTCSANRSWHSCLELIEGSCKYDLQTEISAGSHIAYLVKKGDYTSKTAISRIMLRPCEAEGSYKTVIWPEKRIYGQQIIGFYDTVLDWCKQSFPHVKKGVSFNKDSDVYDDSGWCGIPPYYINTLSQFKRFCKKYDKESYLGGYLEIEENIKQQCLDYAIQNNYHKIYTSSKFPESLLKLVSSEQFLQMYETLPFDNISHKWLAIHFKHYFRTLVDSKQFFESLNSKPVYYLYPEILQAGLWDDETVIQQVLYTRNLYAGVFSYRGQSTKFMVDNVLRPEFIKKINLTRVDFERLYVMYHGIAKKSKSSLILIERMFNEILRKIEEEKIYPNYTSDVLNWTRLLIEVYSVCPKQKFYEYIELFLDFMSKFSHSPYSVDMLLSTMQRNYNIGSGFCSKHDQKFFGPLLTAKLIG